MTDLAARYPSENTDVRRRYFRQFMMEDALIYSESASDAAAMAAEAFRKAYGPDLAYAALLEAAELVKPLTMEKV